MNADCTVCYVSDLGFLLPSLVSAASVRRFVPAHKADVFIFTVGVDGELVERTQRAAELHGIRVQSINERVFAAIDQDRLATTYTPLAMFGRFFMEDLLPRSCQRIVYLDGDVLAMRDPSALIDIAVPEGRFAAAEDTIFYRQKLGFGGTAKGIRKYFAGLGLTLDSGYFNSGVFAVSRSTWKGIAKEAYAYFLKHVDACKHFDQSALNAVIGDRRLRLSAKWNFQTQMKIWGVDSFVEPHICHFNRFPKPWMGPCDPWRDLYAYYQDAVAPFAALNLPLKTLSHQEMSQYNASTDKAYSYLRLPLVARAALRSMNFRGIENRAWM